MFSTGIEKDLWHKICSLKPNSQALNGIWTGDPPTIIALSQSSEPLSPKCMQVIEIYVPQKKIFFFDAVRSWK